MNIRRMLAAMLALLALLAPLASCGKKAETEASAEQLQRGQEAFLAYCAVCHGDRGAADGEMAAALRESGVQVARLDDEARWRQLGRDGVRKVIAAGGAHTGRSNLMPAWGERLESPMIDDIAAYVFTLPARKPGVTEATLQRYLEAPAGVPAEGRRIYVHYCSACHGPYGKGDGPYAEALRQQHNVRPRDLTDSAYIGAKSDADLFAIVSLGGGHMGKSNFMPAWTVSLPPEQIKNVVSYVREISKTAPKP
jgi:mono/diheme cytochrome c family protein